MAHCPGWNLDEALTGIEDAFGNRVDMGTDELGTTRLYDNHDGTFTYTSEDGTSMLLDLSTETVFDRFTTDESFTMPDGQSTTRAFYSPVNAFWPIYAGRRASKRAYETLLRFLDDDQRHTMDTFGYIVCRGIDGAGYLITSTLVMNVLRVRRNMWGKEKRDVLCAYLVLPDGSYPPLYDSMLMQLLAITTGDVEYFTKVIRWDESAILGAARTSAYVTADRNPRGWAVDDIQDATMLAARSLGAEPHDLSFS